MIKKIGITVLLLFLLVGLGRGVRVRAEADDFEPLKQAFYTTGANYVGSEICGWTVRKDFFYSIKQWEDWGKRVAEQYGLDWSSLCIERYEDDDFAVINYKGTLDSGEISFSGHSSRLEWEDGKIRKETYMVITLVTKDPLESLPGHGDELLSLLQKFGGNLDFTYNLHGVYPRHLTKDEQQDLVERFFVNLKGQPGEEIVENHYLSVAGYSPLIKGQVYTGSSTVNVQLALTSYPSDSKTFLVIGSPLISIEY